MCPRENEREGDSGGGSKRRTPRGTRHRRPWRGMGTGGDVKRAAEGTEGEGG